MFPIAICDDEATVCAELRRLLGLHEKTAEFLIYEFHSGEELYGSICAGLTFNLIILDIGLKAMDGVTVGTLLRNQLKDRATEILYISGKQEYAMQLFDLRPLNFLTKPLNEEKFLRCIDTAIELTERNLPCLAFTVQKAIYRVPYRDIRYIESKNKNVIVHAINGEYIFAAKLTDIEKELPVQEFIRIHHSFLIHKLYIRQMKYEQLILDDETALSISQPYRQIVREQLFQMFLRKE
ncbi:LytTR family DNA-binding domain-containing protein [Enterocloster sp. OA13]|uniref:LytR/AlgR family response regulator transcription factor n=1 Tax=Enterocloster sp. OA13 TaxID=2914161 RepID=UPI000471A77A|nr:LytTR family DNA-binding domain-containing protein [Enterocloster sp. OA13]